MKGLKKKLVLCVATAFAAFFAFMFPFGFVPVLAEESENTANYESVLGEGEAQEVYPLYYTMIDSDGKTVVIELLNGRDLTLTLYVEDGAELASVNGWYERTGHCIDIYAYDTYFGCVELHTDGTAVYAEETSEELPPADEDFDEIKDSVMDELAGIIPETEFSLWFKEKILPYILQFLAVAVGALFSFLLVLRKFDIKLGDLINACNVLRKANKDSEDTKAAVQAQDNKLLEWTASQAESMKEWQREQKEQMQEHMRAQAEAMAAGFAQIAADVTNKLDDAVKTVHKILDVEEIAYRENPAMVSKGTAHKIEEVIHGDENEKKDKSDNEA